MYFECATAPADHSTFSVTVGRPDAVRHAFNVCSQVASAGRAPIGSSAAPTGVATARTSAATRAATTHRHDRPAQELTFRTLPGAFRGLQGGPAVGQMAFVRSSSPTTAATASGYQPKIERSWRWR